MLNKILLIGNITKDLDSLRFTSSGTAVTQFTLAVNYGYGDNKKTLFIQCTVFGKSAEACDKYLSKGSQVLVEGRLEEQRWEKDGEQKSRMVVIASDVKFLNTKKKTDETPPEEHSDLEPF